MYGEAFLTLLPFIPISMLVLFFFVALNVLYRALTVPPGFDKENDGHCAACGYVLGTLSDQRCPECGVDLLKSGLLTRRMFIQLRGSSYGAIAAWTVLFFSFGGTSLTIWGAVLQTNQMMSSTFTSTSPPTYTSVVSYGPQTSWNEETREIVGQTFTARIEIAIDSVSQLSAGDIVLVLEMPDETRYTLDIDEDSAWILKDQKKVKVASGKEFSVDAVDQLFELGGLDPKEEPYRSHAGELYVLTDLVVSEGYSGLQTVGAEKLSQIQQGKDTSLQLANYGWTSDYSSVMSTSGFTAVPPIPFKLWSPILYTFIVLFVLYLLGVVWILRRRRKLLNLGRYIPSTSVE